MHFFIDTNVLLSFYSFTQDDLTRLEKLADQIESGTFVVLTTSQVKDEFERRREWTIAQSQKQMGTKRLDMQLPRLCDPYPETEKLKSLAREYSKLHGDLLNSIAHDTRERTLAADHLIERFFKGAKPIDVTSEITATARHRVDLGNPPGKRGSLGDAINWEALLAYSPDDHLFFVTGDGDYYSPIDQAHPREYLTREWYERVGDEITFVRRLKELPEPVPQDALPVDDAPDEQSFLVWALGESGNFATTHSLIAQLRAVPQFTPSQIRELVAALDNTQVGWIIHDEDVHAFYSRLLESQPEDLSPLEKTRLTELLAPPEF